MQQQQQQLVVAAATGEGRAAIAHMVGLPTAAIAQHQRKGGWARRTKDKRDACIPIWRLDRVAMPARAHKPLAAAGGGGW